jgi:hypothetical protein|tara:strand:- start:319 stop:456 length:138 start_codon:yes stop_codon:yes gene_type:complete
MPEDTRELVKVTKDIELLRCITLELIGECEKLHKMKIKLKEILND